MQKMSIKRKCLIGSLLLVFLIVIGISVGLIFNQPANEQKESMEENISTKLAHIPDNMDVVRISGVLEGYTLSELMEYSHLVVYGKVTAISDAFAVEGVGGGITHMMDITVEPIEIMRGEQRDSITIRYMGGQVGDTYEDWSDVPELKLSEKWLFFLYRPSSGGGINTPGDYFYMTGYYQGCFKTINYDKVGAVVSGTDLTQEDMFFINAEMEEGINKKSKLAVPQKSSDLEKNTPATDIVFSLSHLVDIMPSFNKMHPIDDEWTKKESLEAYETNLENGFITQQEYDKLVADLDQYARILTDEDLNATPDPEIEAQKDELRKALEES